MTLNEFYTRYVVERDPTKPFIILYIFTCTIHCISMCSYVPGTQQSELSLRIQGHTTFVFKPSFVSEAPMVQGFKVVFLVHWPGWIGGLATLLRSSYQVINESLRHTEGVSKHSHWPLTTANLLLLQEITSARCRLCGCAPLFMEYERDWLDSAVTPYCHPITHPLDPVTLKAALQCTKICITLIVPYLTVEIF